MGFFWWRVVYASMACTMASTPVIAVTAGGRPSVKSASSTATSGNSTGEDTPALVVSPVVITATGVTSEPVPAVVGTSIRGKRGPSVLPTPYNWASAWLPPNNTATTLATSIELPPPTAITPSTPWLLPKSAAVSTVASGGSSRTWSNNTASMPSPESAFSTGGTRPIAINPGSVTISGRLIPRLRHWFANCKALPDPLMIWRTVLNSKPCMLTTPVANYIVRITLPRARLSIMQLYASS